jgi:hypothetical protein
MSLFVIEDEKHAEPQGEYANLSAAIAELQRRSEIDWQEEPNRAPCMSWETCGRDYVIHEYDNATLPWKLIRSIPAFQISAKGVVWTDDFNPT